jgi:hypothetical protein
MFGERRVGDHVMSVIFFMSRGRKQGFKADAGKRRRLEEGAKEGSRGAMATLHTVYEPRVGSRHAL